MMMIQFLADQFWGGYINLAVIFATCASAPALPARLAHWYLNPAVTGVRGASRRVRFTRREFGGTRPPFYFSLSPPKTRSRLFPLKWASHHIHVLASSRMSRTAAAGGGGEPETNSVHTHTHTHTYIYTVTHTRPQPGLSARRPTSAQLCHTIHLLISALPPLTAAEPSEQTWRPQTFLPPPPLLATVRGRGGNPASIPAQIHSQPRKRWHIFLPPPTTAIPICEPSWAELSWEGGQREEKKKGKKKWHILNRWKSSRCFRVHRECGRAPVPASGVIAAI